MKNKLLNKRFSKMLVTMCLLLTMVLGNCVIVSAEVSSGTLIFLHSTKTGYSGSYIKSLVAESPVYSVLVKTSDRYHYGFVSTSSFSAQVNDSRITEDSSVLEGLTTYNLPVYKIYNIYHALYEFSGDFSKLDRFSYFDIYVDATGSSNQDIHSILKYLGNILGVYDYSDSSYIVDVPGLSPIPSNPEYDSGATATIAPPSGVSYAEFAPSGFEGTNSSRECQLQWDVPEDDTLYLEVNADIYYSGFPLVSNTSHFNWIPLQDGITASSGKLRFELNKPSEDFFAQNDSFTGLWTKSQIENYYLRFCRVNEDKTVSYSLWTKLNIVRRDGAVSGYSTKTGIFDLEGNWIDKHVQDLGNGNSSISDGSELGTFGPAQISPDGDNLTQDDLGTKIESLLSDSNIFETFMVYLTSALSAMGEFPRYIGQLFTFLPQEIIGLLGFGVIIAIILRIIGR